MKTEEGKFYRTRDGQKVGPMRATPEEWGYGQWCWTDADDLKDVEDGNRLWDDNGLSGFGPHDEDPWDLVAEWTDTAPEPARAGLPWARVAVDYVDADGEERLLDVGASMEWVLIWDADGEPAISVTPANARALAAALTAYADQAEAAQ